MCIRDRHYSDLSVKVKEEWNQVFINAATGQTQNSSGGIQDTQASYALAIEYNVISDENRDQAAELLDQACERGYNNVPYTCLLYTSDHNIGKSVAACAAALEAGTPVEKLAKGLDAFKGAGRRFELLGKVNGVTIVDDYAHHPAEIAATLKAAKSLKFNQVWAVHQPFTYSRTKMLLDDFAEALSIADHTVLTEIMGSREKNTYHIYAKDLADKIDGCVWFPTQQEVADLSLIHI